MKFKWLVLITVVIGVSIISMVAVWRPLLGRPAVSQHAGLTIQDVRELAVLTTLRVPVSDVVESKINGYTGGISVILAVRGEVLLGVDCAQVQILKQDPNSNWIRVRLPRPAPLTCGIDHSGTRLYSIDRHGLWILSPLQRPSEAAVNLAYADAENFIREASQNPQMVERARLHAEKILQDCAHRIGWRVEIDWAP